jgi:hypothetical protein
LQRFKLISDSSGILRHKFEDLVEENFGPWCSSVELGMNVSDERQDGSSSNLGVSQSYLKTRDIMVLSRNARKKLKGLESGNFSGHLLPSVA